MGQHKLSQKAAALGIGRLRRHIFLCADQTEPKRCSREEGLRVWEFLKARLRSEPQIFRTKANCLRLREQGPVAVVYPDGAWYRGATAEALARIVKQHLIGGRPLEERIIARDALAPQGGPSGPR